MQGESPHVQVKEPYRRCHSAKPVCTPAHYPREILRIGTLIEDPLCRESRPMCRLKNPTVVYMITCRFSFCKTGVYNVYLLIILERGCSSMYRKKEGLNISHMLKSRYQLFKKLSLFTYLLVFQTDLGNSDQINLCLERNCHFFREV